MNDSTKTIIFIAFLIIVAVFVFSWLFQPSRVVYSDVTIISKYESLDGKFGVEGRIVDKYNIYIDIKTLSPSVYDCINIGDTTLMKLQEYNHGGYSYISMDKPCCPCRNSTT